MFQTFQTFTLDKRVKTLSDVKRQAYEEVHNNIFYIQYNMSTIQYTK